MNSHKNMWIVNAVSKTVHNLRIANEIPQKSAIAHFNHDHVGHANNPTNELSTWQKKVKIHANHVTIRN